MTDTYTLEQIKKAFWSEFHESGELWFDYLSESEENEECTRGHWESFVKELTGKTAKQLEIKIGGQWYKQPYFFTDNATDNDARDVIQGVRVVETTEETK